MICVKESESNSGTRCLVLSIENYHDELVLASAINYHQGTWKISADEADEWADVFISAAQIQRKIDAVNSMKLREE